MTWLVATDLDGTLLHGDGTVTPRTHDVLLALEEAGVTVVFVTGRPIRWVDPLRDDVGRHGLAVCSNGAIVYDVARRAVREARTIPRATGVEVAELLRAGHPGTTFAMGNAHPTVKAAADHLALTNDEDGVAAVLERLFLA